MSLFLILLLLMSITNCEYNGNNRRIPPIHHGPPNVHINRPIQHGPIYHGPPNVHIHRPIHHRPPINRHGYCNSDSAFKICCNGILQNKVGLRPMCCNHISYDSTWNICCHGVIRPKTGLRPMCCGTESYDSNFYKCCNYGIIRTFC